MTIAFPVLQAWPLRPVCRVEEVTVGATNRVYRVECVDRTVFLGIYNHHIWPLEEVYLHGNDRARRFIPHAPFVRFS